MKEEIIEVVKEEIIEVVKHIRQERVHGRTVEHAVDVQVLRILENRTSWPKQCWPGLNGVIIVDVLQFPDWSSLTVSDHSAC